MLVSFHSQTWNLSMDTMYLYLVNLNDFVKKIDNCLTAWMQYLIHLGSTYVMILTKKILINPNKSDSN